MEIEFSVMYRNDVVADIHMKEGKLLNYERYDTWCSSLFFEKYLKVDAEMIFDFCQDIIVKPTRENINEILEANGLEYYDVYALLKLSHGVNPTDDLWVRFKGEDLKWEDVRVVVDVYDE